jgi:hypothetical protein
MSNIPYLEQLTSNEVVTASKAATLALKVAELANQGGGGATLPYKSYVAFLNQIGTSAPTATVVYNDLGGTIVWTRNFAGTYTGTLSSAFTANKTICFLRSAVLDDYLEGRAYYLGRSTNNTVSITTISFNNGGVATDGVLVDTGIEIRVYN